MSRGPERSSPRARIHALSRREAGPFELVNCAADDVEARLTGERGRAGAFEAAQRGTVYLASVEDLGPAAQTKLQRSSPTASSDAPGGRRPSGSTCAFARGPRAILGREVKKGRFREDLLGRLQGVVVSLPPLRTRTEDIPLLLARFTPESPPPEDLGAWSAHSWPGNLDELQSVWAEGGLPGGPGHAFDPTRPFRVKKERWSAAFERRYLTWLMERTGGNISRAAREADMDRKYLHKLLRRHGLVER